jgi:hypothetical protein
MKVYGIILTDCCANAAFLVFKEEAAFINIGDKGNCLSEIYMDGFIKRYVLIKLVRVLDRAVFDTGSATRAFALVNISGLFSQGYLEVPWLPLDTINFS